MCIYTAVHRNSLKSHLDNLLLHFKQMFAILLFKQFLNEYKCIAQRHTGKAEKPLHIDCMLRRVTRLLTTLKKAQQIN